MALNSKRIASALDGKNLLLVAGDPLHLVRCAFAPYYGGKNRSEQLQPWWDNYMVMMHCQHCGSTKFDFDEGNYHYCFNCEAKISDELMMEAATVARKYRFRFNSDFFK